MSLATNLPFDYDGGIWRLHRMMGPSDIRRGKSGAYPLDVRVRPGGGRGYGPGALVLGSHASCAYSRLEPELSMLDSKRMQY